MRNRILLGSPMVSWFIGALIFMPVMDISLVPMALAQSQCSTVLEEVEEAFNIGRLEDVIRLLNSCLPSGIPETIQKLRAYKLLALAYIAENKLEEAKGAVANMLDLNPTYEPDSSQEPAQYVDFVSEAKQQRREEEARLKKSRRNRRLLLYGGTSLGLFAAGGAVALLISGSQDDGRNRLPDPPPLP